MAKNFKTEEFKVKVPGTNFILESNKTYRIIGKVDPSSPQGYQDRGITKYEHPLNSENAIIRFNDERKIWDTGLYADSPCYARMNSEDITETVNILQKHLVPYLKTSFPEDVFENSKESNKYWDTYGFPINQNKTYSTNTPEVFFGIFTAILTGKVAPEEEQKQPRYRQLMTPFIIINSAEKSSNKQKLDFAKSKAVFNLMSGLEKDKELLVEILKYAGFKTSADTQDSILNSMFKRWIDRPTDGAKDAAYFNDAYSKFTKKKGKEELEIYRMLEKGVSKGKITYERSEYFVDDENIGANLKEAAGKINDDDKLKAKLIEIVGLS